MCCSNKGCRIAVGALGVSSGSQVSRLTHDALIDALAFRARSSDVGCKALRLVTRARSSSNYFGSAALAVIGSYECSRSGVFTGKLLGCGGETSFLFTFYRSTAGDSTHLRAVFGKVPWSAKAATS